LEYPTGREFSMRRMVQRSREAVTQTEGLHRIGLEGGLVAMRTVALGVG
jgi:non-canonical (house-cleaning) NTP pyrophosphatase